MKHSLTVRTGIAFGIALGAVALARPASSSLVLTSAGVTDGFTLSTFVSGFPSDPSPAPNACCGPMAVTVMSNGHVLVYNTGNTTNYVFNNLDGQTAASALFATPVPTNGASFPFFPAAAATVGGVTYQNDGYGPGGIYTSTGPTNLYRVDANGSVSGPILTGSAPNVYTELGLATLPNGDLISAGGTGIYEINPVTLATRAINTILGDGLSVSRDGTTGYIATNGCVQSFSIASGALGASFCEGSSDGTGVIAGGPFNGSIVANNNDGTLTLIDPTFATGVQIANGGSRGDYTSPDPAIGSLFLTQTDSVLRLTCPGNCSFATATPEPGSLALLSSAVLGLGAVFRRRQAPFRTATARA